MDKIHYWIHQAACRGFRNYATFYIVALRYRHTKRLEVYLPLSKAE
jgi:hypothetical protein